jgi:hypothetical protein
VTSKNGSLYCLISKASDFGKKRLLSQDIHDKLCQNSTYDALRKNLTKDVKVTQAIYDLKTVNIGLNLS